MSNRNDKTDEYKVPAEPATDSSSEHFDTTAMVLGQALLRFLERSNSRIAEKVLESLIPMASQLAKVETQQKQLNFRLDSIEKVLSNLSSHKKLLENASQTNLLLGKQHYGEHIIQPVVRSLFPVFDLIEDARKHWSHSSQNTELLGAISSQMGQFLATYDVHVIQHQADNKFDPKIMKPITLIPTEDGQLDDHIAESLQVGFQLGTERMLRPETVSLFKYQSSKTNTINPNERTEQC